MKNNKLKPEIKLALMNNAKNFEEEMCVDLLLQTRMTATDLAKLRYEDVDWVNRKINMSHKTFPFKKLVEWDLTLGKLKGIQLPLEEKKIRNNILNVVHRANLQREQIESLLK